MKLSLFLLGWGGALLGVLQLRHLELGHSLCGRWGCGPPLGALLAMHGFWVVLAAPGVFWLCRSLPQRRLFWAGGGLFLSGMIGLAGVLVWVTLTWPEGLSLSYAWPRYRLMLLSRIELPIAQMLVAGLLIMATAMGKVPARRRCDPVESPPTPSDAGEQSAC